MSKHTQGQWMLAEFGKHIQSDDRCHEITVYQADDQPITVAMIPAGPHAFSCGDSDQPYYTISKAEALANARGMAAWTDLLGALEAMHELFADEHDSHSVRGMVCGRAMLAIKKARGEA